MKLFFALIAITAAVALAGCGSTTIDKKKAEDLARQVADSGTVKTKSISCPSNVKVKRGGTFSCDLVYTDGTKGTITLHMNDDKGNVSTKGTDIKIQGK
jgi:hypothetical protein